MRYKPLSYRASIREVGFIQLR